MLLFVVCCFGVVYELDSCDLDVEFVLFDELGVEVM